MWMLEKPINLPGAAEESSFFEDGRAPDKSADLAALSTGAGEPVHGGLRV